MAIVRAYALATVAVEPDLSMKVGSIAIHYNQRVAAKDPSELIFEWFSVTGWTEMAAHANAVAAIVFFLRCRPDMREAIVPVCAPSLRDELLRHLDR